MSEQTASHGQHRPGKNTARDSKSPEDIAVERLQLMKNTAAYCFGIGVNYARPLNMALAEIIACNLHPTKPKPFLDVIVEASSQGASEAQISKAIGRLQPAPGQGLAPVITFERHGTRLCVRLTNIGRWLCQFIEGGPR